MEVPKVDLLTICRGAALQQFERALQRVNANIKDPNTSTNTKRKLTLTFEFKPYIDRSGAEVTCAVDTKLCGSQAVNGSMYIKRVGPEYEAFTQDTSQIDMFETDAEQTQNQKAN